MTTHLARRIDDRLRQLGRRRVPLFELERLLVEAEPALELSPKRGLVLADILDELEADGVVSRAKTLVSPEHRLPSSVLYRGGRGLTDSPGPGTVWRPELAWASGLRLNRPETAFLGQVNAWLRDVDSTDATVPIRERSLEITGDEKRLDGLLPGRLFAPGRLSLELLKCFQVHPPFTWKRFSDRPVALVVENHQTYHSIVAHAQLFAEVGVFVYAAGNHFTGSVTHFIDLEPRVRQILYFGDLDAEGLEIPQRASRIAERAGLARVEPHEQLYRLLINQGRRTPAEPVSQTRAQTLTSWLGPDLEEEVTALLIAGQRLAQEAVGAKLLRACGHSLQPRLNREQVKA